MDEIASDHDFPAWGVAVGRIGKLQPIDQLQAVNQFVDSLSARDGNYGLWSSPRQILMSGGWCGDRALAKHQMLVELGWPRDDMRIAALLLPIHDFAGHAVLVVRYRDHDYVLDNMTPRLLVDRWNMDGTKFLGQAYNYGLHVGIAAGAAPLINGLGVSAPNR